MVFGIQQYVERVTEFKQQFIGKTKLVYKKNHQKSWKKVGVKKKIKKKARFFWKKKWGEKQKVGVKKYREWKNIIRGIKLRKGV